MMISGRSLSTNGSSSSSTASGSVSTLETQEEIFRRLKTTLFGANLIEHLESHPEEGSNIIVC